MEWLKYVFGVIGGLLLNSLGGFDLVLQTLLALVVLDYISGVLKAGYRGKLSTKIGFKGICRKVAMFFAIMLTVIIERILGGSLPLREITIMFFIVNESLSIIENLGRIIKLPDEIERAVKSLKGGSNNGDY